MQFLLTVRTGFRLAFRARFGLIAVTCLLFLTGSAVVAAQFSGRQPSTIALDVGISAIRLALPIVLILLTQELLSQEFDRRYFLNTFAYPVSRQTVLLGRFTAIVLLTILLLLTLTSALAMVVYLVNKGYSQTTPVALGNPFLVSSAFVALDLIVLAAFATLLAVTSSTPSFLLIGTIGFMLIARSFGAIIELLNTNPDLVSNTESYRSNIDLLRYFLPDLGALDVRVIALYGRMELLPTDWPWLLLSNITYTVVLLTLAGWALHYKRFG